MNISAKKKAELYKAFSDPIMRKRIYVQQHETNRNKAEEFDFMLYQLENEIWKGIVEVLEIKNP